ncbi:ABC transporter substrate-binding protein [Xanthomonas arboricola]|uniref:ABC transporter substrate-binding protein n=1 Tax=Xanthomonas arboricola TaxID=56448 RepID=UPI000CEF3869|nr:ABC transporter substrate-binding protein [Xanthomonas arboricola]PPT63712.1 nitrate ABC transporter substrate-binding protein [Xanthomonas arboricola]CAG2085461.1 ABC transporter substrate-binding protein [Xanthomonas arboricola pv. juglandis]
MRLTVTSHARPQRRRFSRHVALLLLAALPLLHSAHAQAEGKLRIAKQFGIVYLLLDVAQDQKLIEQQGKAAGVDIDVQFLQLSGGAAVNDALLTGSIDIAGAGVGPLFTIWDRTHGRQNVRGVASLGNFPYYLISNNPRIKSIGDFTPQDRIAVPATGVSVQSRFLQHASQQRWGDKGTHQLDPLQVALPHPDAAAAIIRGRTEITAHFASPPFQEQELARNPAAHIVTSSYEIEGGPSSATVLYATEKFRRDNPKTYRAFVAALDQAARFVTAHPEQAADIFLRRNGSSIDRALVLQILKDPKVQFTVVPQNTLGLGKFMQHSGAIKQTPSKLSDYFFDDPLIAGGS